MEKANTLGKLFWVKLVLGETSFMCDKQRLEPASLLFGPSGPDPYNMKKPLII